MYKYLTDVAKSLSCMCMYVYMWLLCVCMSPGINLNIDNFMFILRYAFDGDELMINKTKLINQIY